MGYVGYGSRTGVVIEGEVHVFHREVTGKPAEGEREGGWV